MKNRTTMLTADSRQPTADSRQPTADSRQPMIVRLKHKLKNNVFTYYPLRCVMRCVRFIRSYIKWQIYKRTVTFNPDGLNIEPRDRKIIVSITSYPARINVVPYAIASILNQTMKPDKIILWLGEGKFTDRKLPKAFDKLRACGVDIEFREDIGPHTKYFYAMKEYPEDIIITFDDDTVYERDVIEKLYKSYVRHPGCVSCMAVHKINFMPDGDIAKFDDWKIGYEVNTENESHAYFAPGVCGALYPPHSLHKEAFNLEALKGLCLKNDDVWLKVMEVMNGTKVARAASGLSRIPGFGISGSQKTALNHINDAGGGNELQIRAVLCVYNNFLEGKTLLEIIREDADVVE